MEIKNQTLQHIKSLVLGQRVACLSTICRVPAGPPGSGDLISDFPFGSVVPFTIAGDGKPVILISLIAEHYKNLAVNPRASLLITDAFAAEDPAGRARLTIMAEFKTVPAADIHEAAEKLLSAVPSEIRGNFSFFAGQVKRIRWIGGFGMIGWVEPETWKELWD